MIYLGAERYITQTFEQHKTAEDYSGNHLSPIKITGVAKVIRVVNKYKVHEDSINNDDFIQNQNIWRDGDYYNCVSITGKIVRFPKDELGGNCVRLEGYINNEKVTYELFHMASVNVKVGDIVDSNTILGLQGNTGLVDSGKSRSDVTYGTHVHMEVRNSNGNFINPRNYALGSEVINYIEQTNNVDTLVDQILIVADKINIRENPNVSSLDLGDVYKDEIYTVLDSKEDDLYSWYNIKTNLGLTGWVASSKLENWINFIKASTKEIVPELKDDTIVTLTPTIPSEDIDETKLKDNSYILLFTCPKTDTYYLKLQEGEKLYLQKKEEF